MMGIQNFALVVFSFLLILLMDALPLWLVMAAFGLALWKGWILRTQAGQPSRVLISAMGTLMIALVFLENAPAFSRESMMAITCIASILFLLDRPHRMQIMLAHGSFYGLLVALLVMRGNPLPLFLYFFLTVLIFFSLLLHHLPPTAIFSLWPLGRNIVKISLPVAAILLPVYFFFPEIRSPSNEFAVSGLSDVLEPGRIARLALSDRVAFRVRFLSDIPAGQALYWRSTVLEESFGMIWRKKRLPEFQEYTPRTIQGTLEYEMIPEVRLGLALPLLEHTMTARGIGRQPSQIWWHPDLRLFQTQNEIIQASASPHDRFVARVEPVREALTITLSDRVQAWVSELRALSPEQQVQSLAERFQSFTYTLQPGNLTSDDTLDEFLFEKRRGFCEHFAAAFATLLQLAGTPARVVTGFSGGVFIGASNFMLVRDSDAHAWTEVFLDGRWRRVDPASYARSEVRRAGSHVWITALPSAWFAYGLRLSVVKLREWTQEFEYLWMGLICLLTIVVPLQIWRMQKRRRPRPVWQTAMDRLLLDLQKRGIQREKHEGMRDFLNRVAQEYPEESVAIEALSTAYQQVLYGPPGGTAEAAQLSRSFRQLRRLLQKSRHRALGG